MEAAATATVLPAICRFLHSLDKDDDEGLHLRLSVCLYSHLKPRKVTQSRGRPNNDPRLQWQQLVAQFWKPASSHKHAEGRI